MSAPRTILLTGGRAAATLELARLLHRAGHRVVMAEHIWWHLSRPSRAIAAHHLIPWPTRDLEGFAGALAEIIERERIDLFIPTCEEIFHVARVRDRLPEGCEVFAADLEALDRLHHKRRFVEVARACGLSAPESVEVAGREALRQEVARWLERGDRVVLKPVYSRFAAQAVIDPDDAGVVDGLDMAVPWLVQRFIPGRRLCTWGIAHRGRLVAHTTYETRFTLGVGASVSFEHLEHPGAQQWAERFVAGEGFTGQLGLDLIEAPDGALHGIEANPRITSGLHLLAHLDGIVEAFWTPEGPLLKPVGGPPAMLGVSMLMHLLGEVRSWEAFRAWWGVWSRSREVAHSLRDPLPMVWRFVWLGGLVTRARRTGLPPQQAISIDMEWNGER